MMRRTDRVLVCAVVAQLLAGPVASARPGDDFWVFLRDKPDAAGARLVWGELGAGHPAAELDLEVDPGYVSLIERAGPVVRARSRWFNAVSVRATASQLRWLEAQPFVLRLRPVGRFRRPPPLPEQAAAAWVPQPGPKGLAQDYGPSFAQMSRIGVVALHNLGYLGQGVRIALLDNGFHHISHPAFGGLRVVAARDFINGDDVVTDQDDQPVTPNESTTGQNIHGAQVLSLLAGHDPGNLVGVAPEAEYILAKTEDNGSELPVEEDRWIQGLEWAQRQGAQVVNSSLGYSTWDDGSGYTYEQMDGATALTSRAAQMAVERGIVVVVSAGNEGAGPWRYITAPADAPGVVTVGAVDSRDSLAAFSSRGPAADGRVKPDLVAPGVGLVAADIRGGGYSRSRGTSFAAPLVSGVCALLLQTQPDWDPARVLEALRETATDLGPAGPDTLYGWGLVNALEASAVSVSRPTAAAAGIPFPNPAATGVVYFPLQLPEAATVALKVYDLSGSPVADLERRLEAGDYSGAARSLPWEVPPNLGSGVYFYQLRAATFTRLGKIALVR